MLKEAFSQYIEKAIFDTHLDALVQNKYHVLLNGPNQRGKPSLAHYLSLHIDERYPSP